MGERMALEMASFRFGLEKAEGYDVPEQQDWSQLEKVAQKLFKSFASNLKKGSVTTRREDAKLAMPTMLYIADVAARQATEALRDAAAAAEADKLAAAVSLAAPGEVAEKEKAASSGDNPAKPTQPTAIALGVRVLTKAIKQKRRVRRPRGCCHEDAWEV